MVTQKIVAPLLLCIFAWSFLLFAPTPTTAQQNREILRLGRGTANALDWRPDGEVLAVGGGAGIWLYDENFQDLAHLYADVGQFTNVSWSPDGSRLVALTGSPGGILQMWRISDDAADGEVLWTLTDIPARDISWKPDGTQFATTGDNHLLRIRDAVGGKVIREILDVGALGLAWSPDGKKLAGTSSDQYHVKIWDPATGEIVMALESVASGLFWTSVTWSPDGQKLAGVTSLPASLHVWDIATGALLNSPELSDDMYGARKVLWDKNGEKIITLSNTATHPVSSGVSLWETAGWKIVEGGGYQDGIRDISLRPNDDIITALTWGNLLLEWSSWTGEAPKEYRFFNPPIYHLAWSPDSDQIATSSYGGGYPVEVWDLSQVNDTKVIEQPTVRFSGDVIYDLPWSSVTSLTWIADDELVTTSRNEPINYIFNRAEKWDAKTGESRGIIFSSEGYCGVYGWNSDFSVVACTNYGNTAVEIRNAAIEKILFTILVENVRSIIWSPNNQLLAISQFNTEGMYPAGLWSASTGEQLAIYHSYMPPRWSPDSRMLALSTRDDEAITFQIVNVQTGEIELNLESAGVITWSPDSQTIALSRDDAIEFYDVMTGSRIERASAPNVSALAWSPDGKMLALAADDGTIRIWDVSNFAQKN